MNDENTSTLTGRLTTEPELINKGNGKYIVKFGIAVHYGRGRAYFFDCVGYDQVAKFTSDFFHKGNYVFMRGSLRQFKKKDETSGRFSNFVEIICHRLQLLAYYEDKSEVNNNQEVT